MDSLALLCNLYGDGPTTLRRLRDAGCRECDDVERLQLEELARVLDATSEAARRFQAEAHDLATRVAHVDGEKAEANGGTQLRPDLLDGLDLEACVQLRGHGVESLEDLAGVEPLELSRSMEIGVTRVMRLQFLARRWLESALASERASQATVVPKPRTASKALLGERFSPSETSESVPVPRLESDLGAWTGAKVERRDEAPSGPFA